jgi:glycerol uptake facilitator-like aquaporin
LGQPILV